jgi:hypothetical protein
MRTRHQAVAALVLVVILAAPVLGGVHSEPASLVFAPVPDHGARLEPSHPRATGVIVDLPVRPVRDGPGPDVEQPSPRGITGTLRPEPTPGTPSDHSARGVASWYCGHGSHCTVGHSGGLYAAAGPALRVGNWRGRTVVVRAVDSGRTVRVRLIDCNCGPHANLVDLYSDAFLRLGSLSRGVLKVSVTW